MIDNEKTREQILHELTELRSQNAELKKSVTGGISAELAAGEARRYAESIVETVREPLLVLDADLKIISANRSFYRTFQVTPGEAIGSFISDLGNKQWDIPKLRELLETILPQKTTFDNYEVEHDFAIIGRRIMLLNARQIQRVFGKERVILLAIEDITERKRVENLLTESEERFRRLFETASDGIVLLEKGEGKITHANPATEKMLGYTKAQSIGNKLSDIGVLLDMGDFQTTMVNLNKSGILNYRNVTVESKSGQHIVTDIYLVDRAKLVQCNIRDITEQKITAEKLMKSESDLRMLIAKNVDGLMIVDVDGTLRFMNPAAKFLFGRPAEELIGKPMGLPLVSGQEAEEMDITGADGLQCTVEMRASSIHWEEKKAFLLSLRDITRRKQASMELQLSLEKLRKTMDGIIQAMALAVEVRDPYTAGHQRRVADLARSIGQEMGLLEDQLDGLRLAGIVHDLGKIAVPVEILSKPTKLSNLEFGLTKVHPQVSYDILKDIDFPWPLAEIVFQHHERLDGSGYPRGLKGDEICVEAQILMVADVVEAIASHRPYRPALGIEVALEEIEKNRGLLYDTEVVDVCLRLFKEKGFSFE